MKLKPHSYLRSTVAVLTLAMVATQPLLLFGQEGTATNDEAVPPATVENEAAEAEAAQVETAAAAQENSSISNSVEPEATTEPNAEEDTARPVRRSQRERVGIGASLTVRQDESVGEAVAVFGDSKVDGEVSREMVTIFGDATMNGSVKREMVTVLGDAKMNGSVGREMVTVLGNAEVNGPVNRELVVVFGNLKLGPNARVGRDCVAVFGKVERDPAAQLAHEPIQILPIFSGLSSYFRAGPLLGRPMVARSAIAWFVVALFFVFYFLIALLLSRPVAACQRKVALKPFQCFGVGLLTMILLAPLFFILVATGVGVLLIPLIGLAELIFAAVGRTAMMQYFGSRILGRPGDETDRSRLLKLIAGFALVTLIYMVPILGMLFWAVLRPFGLGCAIMALFGSGRKTPNHTPYAQVRVQQQPSARSDAPAATTAAFSQSGTIEPSKPPGVEPPPVSSASAQNAPPSASGADTESRPRAGFWIRTMATALDFVPLILIFAFAKSYFLLIWLAYHIAMWAWKGTTLGGMICKLKVERTDGRPVDFSAAFVRGLASIFSAVALMLGFFWVGWTAERRSWHDIIADTVIVRVPKSASLI